jgi:hypothetical protein
MARQPGFFDVDDRLADLSAKGDDLERLNAVVVFAPRLIEAGFLKAEQEKRTSISPKCGHLESD